MVFILPSGINSTFPDELLPFTGPREFKTVIFDRSILRPELDTSFVEFAALSVTFSSTKKTICNTVLKTFTCIATFYSRRSLFRGRTSRRFYIPLEKVR